MTVTVCNLLLQAMSESDRSLLHPLEQVDLQARAQIEEADTSITLTYVYFPKAAVTTLFAGDIEGNRVTLALIGVEGMTGLPLLYARGQSRMDIRVQVPGSALRVPARRVSQALRTSRTLQDLLLGYALTVQEQLMSATVANATGNAEQRLARWLLMYQDRTGHDRLHLSHDALADTLSLRRQHYRGNPPNRRRRLYPFGAHGPADPQSQGSSAAQQWLIRPGGSGIPADHGLPDPGGLQRGYE